MDSSQPPVHTADYTHSSGLSEMDSLSDSDWLDISSSKESDDNDSISSRASDHDEVDYGSHSRRSSMSVGSSRDGDVEAWEGLTEDSADELVIHDDLIGLSIPPTLPPALRNAAVSLDDVLALPRDMMEDQHVNAALDQSMTGTLSTSRTSSLEGHASTAQNSIRDLKLSFPDPLTSSRDELNTTCEDASPSEMTSDDDVVPPSTTRAVDPGPSATPEVLTIVVSKHRLQVVRADLEIVLYGISAVARWSIVHNLLEKAAIGAGLTLRPVSKTSEQHSRNLEISGNCEAINSFPKVVAVIDKTSGRFSYDPVGFLFLSANLTTMTWLGKSGRFQGARPSLAIIFIPSMSSVSVTHTCYLPIFVSSDNISIDEARRKDAESWSRSSIETDAFFSVKQNADLLDIGDVADLEALQVHNALGCLMRRANDIRRRHASLQEAQMTIDRNISQLLSAAIIGSLLALVVILLVRLGVSGAKQVPTPALQTTNLIRGRIPSVTNKSSGPITPNGAAVIPSSLKDFALSVFNPAPLSAPAPSLASPAKHCRSAGGANTETTKATKQREPEYKEVKLMTWSERMKLSKDIIMPGSCSLSFEARSKKALSLIVPKNPIIHTEEPPSALSVRLADSLSRVFDVKALSEVVRHDIKELSDALDQLLITISEQTAAIAEESKGKSKVLRERLEQRHGKAKARARRLKEMGGQLKGQLLSYVGNEIKDRANQAKCKAHEMAETLLMSDAWTSHRKRVEEHRKRMEVSSFERQKRREIRRARRQARAKNEGKNGSKRRSRISSKV